VIRTATRLWLLGGCVQCAAHHVLCAAAVRSLSCRAPGRAPCARACDAAGESRVASCRRKRESASAAPSTQRIHPDPDPDPTRSWAAGGARPRMRMHTHDILADTGYTKARRHEGTKKEERGSARSTKRSGYFGPACRRGLFRCGCGCGCDRVRAAGRSAGAGAGACRRSRAIPVRVRVVVRVRAMAMMDDGG
jgi:hypothetical protein